MLSEHERRVLLPQQARQQRMGFANAFIDEVAIDAHPERERVDEHAHHTVCSVSGLHPTEEDGAEYDIVATRRPSDHQRPGKVKKACGADVQSARVSPQAARQRTVQIAYLFLDPVTVAENVGEPEWGGGKRSGAGYMQENQGAS